MEQNEVALLIKKLKDVLPQERLNAAKALGEIGDKYAFRPLIDALGDDNSSVRVAVVEAIGQIGGKSALDSLIEMMGDEDSSVRDAASEALRRLGEGELANRITDVLEGKEDVILSDKRCFKALIKALSAPAPINERAVNALVNLGAAESLVVEALWGKDESVRGIAADGLIRIGDAAVEPLLEKLADSHGRKRAMDILIRMGEEKLARLFMDVLRGAPGAIEKLVKANGMRTIAPLMESVSPFVESKICVRAIEALGEMKVSGAVEKLTGILTRHRSIYQRYCDNVESVFSAVPTALGKIGGKQAIESLLLASEDDEAYVRAKAALALGRYHDEWVTDRLLLLLNDEDADVCAAAADSLGDIGDANAVDSLIEALEDEGFPARENVARALGNIGDERAVPALIKALESFGAVHLSAVDALVKISGAAVEPLINALRQHPSPRLKEDAIKALSRIGDRRAVESLGEILLTDWNLHERAAEALKRLGEDEFATLLIDVMKGDQEGLTLKMERADDGRLINTLLKALNAPDEQIRKRVVEALGRKKAADAVEPLIEVLKDYDVEVRQSAAKALGQIGDDVAIEPLIEMLREDEIARRNAADALVAFGNASCTPLIRILGDKNPVVRKTAKETLERLGEGDFAALITGVLDGEEEALTQLEGANGDRALIPLLTALNSTDVQLKKRAAEALGKIGNENAVEPLLKSLNDTDITVRESAILALGQIGDVRALEPLTKSLKDKDNSIRVTAIDALTQFGADAMDILMEALTQPNARVRQKAARALGQLKASNAIDSLITALGDSEAAVRQSAVIALGEIGDTNAIIPLTEIIMDDITGISINAVDAISKMGGEPAVRTLIKILGHDDERVRKRSTEALVQIGAAAVEPLIRVLKSKDPTARQQAVTALGQIGDARAIPALQKLARVDIARIWHISREKSLRQAAKEAIDKISS